MTKSSRPPSFHERLREIRELRGLQQSDLARKTELQPSAISHFEAGARKPSFDNLRRLADALDVTTDFLLGRTDEPGTAPAGDVLYRDMQNLKASDRELAKQMVQFLATRDSKKKE